MCECSVHVCMHAHTLRPEVDIVCPSLSLDTLFVKAAALTERRVPYSSWCRWPLCPRDPCPCLLSSGVTGSCPCLPDLSLDSDCHVFTESVLSTKPPPQPKISFSQQGSLEPFSSDLLLFMYFVSLAVVGTEPSRKRWSRPIA